MAMVTRLGDTALWFEIVHDAEKSCAISLHQELESYLVFLLMRYVKRPDLVQQVMATSFLAGLQASPRERIEILRSVGDQCLLLTGLYPGIVKKRHVRIGYFVGMGQTAYVSSSFHRDDIYAQLGGHFVPLMDVLQSVRRSDSQLPDLLPFEAWELWSETGSQRALSILRQYTNAVPMVSSLDGRKPI